jgi:hypothetical protein
VRSTAGKRTFTTKDIFAALSAIPSAGGAFSVSIYFCFNGASQKTREFSSTLQKDERILPHFSISDFVKPVFLCKNGNGKRHETQPCTAPKATENYEQ